MNIYENPKIQKILHEVEKETDSEKAKLLKNKVIDHISWNLFTHCTPAPGKEEIIVTGRVMYDGKGDWFAMLNMCDAVTFSQFHAKLKSIDCVCPVRGDITEIEETISLFQFEKYGIGSIKIISFDDDKKVEKTIHLNENGIEMRIIDVSLLSAKDFKILTRISAALVGCTGDNSIAQVLSFGKIPCYEAVGHKYHFLNNLLELIESKFGKGSALFQYVHASSFGKKTAEFVQKPELIEQAKELGNMIREHFSFNPILKGMVNKCLFRQTDADFAAKADRIRQDFLDSKIMVEEAEKQLTEELIAKKWL